jgi:hypothetical protein
MSRIVPGSVSVVLMLLAGCSATSSVESAPETTGPRLESAPDVMTSKHLASLAFPDDHYVRFYRTAQGDVLTVEQGSVGQPSLIEPIADKSPASVFASLAPTIEMPAAFVDAARAAKALSMREVDSPISSTPSTSRESAGQGAQFYTAGEMQWFANSFCPANGTTECLTGYNWANTSWDSNRKSRGLTAWAAVGSEDTSTATFTLESWGCNCSFLFVCCGDGWNTDWTDSNLSQGRWESVSTGISGSSRARMWLNNNGSGTVGIADKYQTY